MIVKIKGGLGNQLFQYAYGQSVDAKLYDISWYRYNDREFELDKFRVSGNFDNYGRGVDGYWQKYRYIEKNIEQLRWEVALRDEFKTAKYLYLLEGVQKVTSVAMHIRRDDYLTGKNLKKFNQLGLDYYAKAYDLMKGITGGFYLFLFSDDLNWCRENLRYDAIYVDLSTVEAFDLMRQCDHHIIANSTYSYWAAVLDKGAVIAPARWRNDDKVQENYVSGLMPDRFLTL